MNKTISFSLKLSALLLAANIVTIQVASCKKTRRTETTVEKPATSWGFTLGDRSILSQDQFPTGTKNFFTDGSVAMLKIGNQHYGFWGNYANFRTISTSPKLEDHLNNLNPATPVLGGRQADNGQSNGFTDGGIWLIGVRQLADGRLAGFFHAESHWYPRGTHGWKAYKSIGVAYSSNNGQSWGDPYLIIKHETDKPTNPDWSGLGDGSVIYNHITNRYYCFYTPATGATAISMAASTDPNGYVGSWNKWYNTSFGQPGLSGKETPIVGLASNPGANPSVHWNTFLKKFIMAYHGWDGKLYISASDDCENWETPRLLLEDGPKAWYPNIIGTSSTEGGKSVTLYYAYDFQPDGTRKLASRTLTFSKQ